MTGVAPVGAARMLADEPALRERLRKQEPLLASFGIELASPTVPEALAQAGFDVLIVDSEHSAFGLGEVAALVTACRAAGIAVVIRVPGAARESVTRVADMWPDGIMFPGIESAEQAKAVVSLAKYAPEGSRGVCPMLRYEPLPASRYRVLNERLALFLQIEGEAALEQAEAIARVPCVDALFVGPYDLSQSLGVTGEIEHPRVLDAGRRLRANLPPDTALGVYVSSGEAAKQWLELGASFVAYATDALIFLAGCRAAAGAVRDAANSISRVAAGRP